MGCCGVWKSNENWKLKIAAYDSRLSSRHPIYRHPAHLRSCRRGLFWYWKNARASVAVNTSQNANLTSGLVGLWSFDGADVSGTTAYDRSGSANNGTLTNGPTPTIGKIGQALAFNGTNQYVNMGNVLDFERTVPFSISAWVKTTSSAPSTPDHIVSKVDGSNIGYGISIRGDIANDPVEFELRGSGTYVSARSNQVWVANQWTHLVWTNTGSGTVAGQKLYRDGILQSSVTDADNLATNITNTGNFNVGAFRTLNPFDGAIDEVRIYSRALTAAEITALYDLGR